jgi:hypothetical protein
MLHCFGCNSGVVRHAGACLGGERHPTLAASNDQQVQTIPGRTTAPTCRRRQRQARPGGGRAGTTSRRTPFAERHGRAGKERRRAHQTHPTWKAKKKAAIKSTIRNQQAVSDATLSCSSSIAIPSPKLFVERFGQLSFPLGKIEEIGKSGPG